jgi:hypothetical protein
VLSLYVYLRPKLTSVRPIVCFHKQALKNDPRGKIARLMRKYVILRIREALYKCVQLLQYINLYYFRYDSRVQPQAIFDVQINRLRSGFLCCNVSLLRLLENTRLHSAKRSIFSYSELFRHT